MITAVHDFECLSRAVVVWYEDTLTDVPPEKLAIPIMKAKLLEYLPKEIPFKVKPVLEHWGSVDSGNFFAFKSTTEVVKGIVCIQCINA